MWCDPASRKFPQPENMVLRFSRHAAEANLSKYRVIVRERDTKGRKNIEETIRIRAHSTGRSSSHMWLFVSLEQQKTLSMLDYNVIQNNHPNLHQKNRKQYGL